MSKRTGRPRGGKRQGAGRPAGVTNAATEARRRETRQAIEDDANGTALEQGASAEYLVALQLLRVAKTAEEDAVRLDALKHLDNRLQGRPREALEISGPGGGPLGNRTFVSCLSNGDPALAPPPALPPAKPSTTSEIADDADHRTST